MRPARCRAQSVRYDANKELLRVPIDNRYERTLPPYRDADLVAAFMPGLYGWMCGPLRLSRRGSFPAHRR
jgi:hypothetical protein